MRTKVGIGATVLTLLILVIPGQMELPLTVLIPLMPKNHSCFNPAAPFVFLVFLGLGLFLSLGLFAVGIVGVVLAAIGTRAGLVMSVLFNAVVTSLLLIPPITFSAYGPPDPGSLGLFAVLAVCAIVPVAAMVLLLVPAAYRWSRLFMATALVAGLLLVPGAVGGVAFGLELAGLTVIQPAPSDAGVTQHAC